MSTPNIHKQMMPKIFKFLIIFLVITGWVFSGFPQISGFPPKIQKAQAATGLQFVGKASNSGTGATYTVSLTSLTGGVGSSAAAGDLVIVVTGWASAANGNPGVNTAGYTEVYDLYDSDTRDANMSVNWKTMGPTPDTSVTALGFNNAANGGATSVQVWRNAASTTPMDVTPPAGVGGPANAAHPDSPSITPVTTGAYVLTVGMGTGDTGPLPQTAPSGYGNATSTTGFGSTMSIIADIASIAWGGGAVDPGAWTGGDADSGSDSWVAGTLAIRPAATFLGNDTNPGVNPTIAPGAATTTVGTFNLLTTGYSDTVTNATTTLATGTGTSTVAVLITNSANTTTYCTVFNPTGDTIGLTGCDLPVTNASTTFNIRIKPLTHSAMPAPPGNTYVVTATITAITATNNNTSGTDTTSDTVTIDNASPNGATATSGTAGDAKVTLNWTASNSSSDFDTTNGSVILRWAAAGAGSEVPAEGKSDYVAGNTISTATVACVISSTASASLSKIDGSGGDTGCTTAVLTNGQQYTYVAFQRDTNGNYDAGASIGTFTPGASLTFTVDVPSVLFVGGLTPGTPVSTSSVLTVNSSNSTGYNIKIVRASTTPTLFLAGDINTTIADNPNGNNWTAPAATSTAGPSAVWTSGTTKGLGFRLKQTGTAVNTYSTVWWGTSDADANAKYSGIATSSLDQKIVDTTLGSGSDEKTVAEYKVDVIESQKSGAYTSSPVTYTALAN